jgi:hypothetical protein
MHQVVVVGKIQSPVVTAIPVLRAALGAREDLWRTTFTRGNKTTRP